MFGYLIQDHLHAQTKLDFYDPKTKLLNTGGCIYLNPALPSYFSQGSRNITSIYSHMTPY